MPSSFVGKHYAVSHGPEATATFRNARFVGVKIERSYDSNLDFW
jgi:hypothetical protein